MEKLIIEVGSTCTKVDLFDGQEINRIKTETIEFKRNYKKENKLDKDDIEKIIGLVKELKDQYQNVLITMKQVHGKH